jgi:GlpG protein
MRQIGAIDDKNMANIFSDYLTQAGIENEIQENPGSTVEKYEIWIYYEDEVETSEEMLDRFLKYPDEPEFREAPQKAKKIKKQARKEEKEGPQYVDARTSIFYRGASPSVGGLTLILIIASVLISVASKLGANLIPLRPFFITDFLDMKVLLSNVTLLEIKSGQIWRLFTPMFIHFGVLHLVFNMMWLWDLGSMVEDRKGTLFFAVFILVVSGASNLAQFMVSGPSFGGMSGVVYGLLGYIWMKGRYDPRSHLALHKTTVAFMIGWFFLCWTGFMGHIANTAHTVGLVTGVAWGYLSSGRIRHLMEMRKWKE